jgi:uncharacterized protein (TIGR00369 family)
VSAAAAVRSRRFAWADPLASAAAGEALSGLEFLAAIRDGRLPPPPVAAMLGMEIVEVETGRAVFALEPAEWMYNPIGSVHGGVVATILDSCMGCAVHSTMEAGAGYATSDLQVRYLRPIGVESGRVLGEGRVVHAGGRVATAEGLLRAQDDGSLLAHATTACQLLRPGRPPRG